MSRSAFFLVPALATLTLAVGCIRSYHVTPMSNVSFAKEAKAEQVTLKLNGFLSKTDITEKFGKNLAEDQEVVPVQVQLTNQGSETYKVLRAAFLLEETAQKARLDALTLDQAYELGRHGMGAPVWGFIFFGPLAIPSWITTTNANDHLREDYSRKMLNDALLEPNKEVSGVLFFDPASKNLDRTAKYKLIVELQNAKSAAKVVVEQAIN